MSGVLPGWAGRPDRIDRCVCSGGAVADDEDVVVFRVINKEGPVPLETTFKRERLLSPKGDFSNECGQSEGASVERRRASNSELVALAQQRAKARGRSSDGFTFARAENLRSIRVDGDSAPQSVFIYDDGGSENENHAVIRVRADPTAFDDIRTQIVDAFRPNLIEGAKS